MTTDTATPADANFLTDNPALYERRFPDPDRVAARWAHDTAHRYGAPVHEVPAGDVPTRDVLDLGCGTGRDAGYLASLGHRVHGLDASARMIAYARTRYPQVTFTQGDFRTFDLGRRFDVVTCLDSAMLYCHTNADLAAFLACCRAHLRPGGLLVAEMRNGSYFLGNTDLLDIPTTTAFDADGVTYTSHTRLWIDHAAQLLRRRREWTWPGCAEPLTQASAWRLLFPRELELVLDQAGFDLLALHDRPGPRTEPVWTPGAEPGGDLSGDRLHVVARLRD